MERSTHTQGDSGYLTEEVVKPISKEFTQVEVLSQSEVTVVARGIRYGRWHLLKALRPEVAGQQMYRQMLVKEFGILMQLNHPGVVQCVDFCTVDPLGKCIVMEWIEGETLDEWLIDHGDRQTHRRVVDQLLDVVAHIHSHGIVHRDLKPANIMLTDHGKQVKLIDFGLADTDAHVTLKQPAGTRGYMAPEQLIARNADTRNDIYSLGVIMRQMNLGWALRHVVARCLRPIDERWQSVEELQQAIARVGRYKRWLCRLVSVAVLAGLLLGIWLLQPHPSTLESELQATTDSLQQVVIQLDSHVVAQKAEVAQKTEVDEQRMAVMNEGLNAVTTASQSLQQAQDASVRRQGQVAAAVQQGRRNVDQAMRATHIKEHLDTVTSYKYVRPNFNLDLLAGHYAIERYMSQLQGQFSAAELTTIRKQLEDYYRSAWLDPLNRKLGVRL